MKTVAIDNVPNWPALASDGLSWSRAYSTQIEACLYGLVSLFSRLRLARFICHMSTLQYLPHHKAEPKRVCLTNTLGLNWITLLCSFFPLPCSIWYRQSTFFDVKRFTKDPRPFLFFFFLFSVINILHFILGGKIRSHITETP